MFGLDLTSLAYLFFGTAWVLAQLMWARRANQRDQEQEQRLSKLEGRIDELGGRIVDELDELGEELRDR